MTIEPITDRYKDFVDTQIAESWAGPFVVTNGVLHDTRTHPGFVAVQDGAVIGYILYHLSGGDCEITVLESLCENQGAGRSLIDTVIRAAKELACRRVWLITTNDNTHAIRFYQRFGFELRTVRIGATDDARKFKPQIPPTGCDGIPIRHEFEFEIRL